MQLLGTSAWGPGTGLPWLTTEAGVLGIVLGSQQVIGGTLAALGVLPQQRLIQGAPVGLDAKRLRFFGPISLAACFRNSVFSSGPFSEASWREASRAPPAPEASPGHRGGEAGLRGLQAGQEGHLWRRARGERPRVGPRGVR